MMTAAGILLLFMTVMIGADVLLRNIDAGGIPPSNELSEDILYLITLLAAPGLLRRGQHIRVDIVLQVLPHPIGWLLEWVGDVVGLICCLIFVWYGADVAAASFFDGSVSSRRWCCEWWLLAPMPLAFALLALEFGFRIPTGAGRTAAARDAVSASEGSRGR
jgi:TRAP-type C4-dicarboxylate transport system permease small subunit